MAKDTRDRILQACISCFADQGYAGTTTRTLAAAAQVNVATLAYHFGDKEGLYTAAIDSLYERFQSVQPDLSLLAADTSRERVERVVRFAYGFAREQRTAVRLLLRHVLEEGSLPGKVRDDWALKLLDVAESAWGLIGLPPDPHWKLKLLAVNHLVVRFAITPEQDLAPFTDAAEPHKAIEEVLIDLVVRALLKES